MGRQIYFHIGTALVTPVHLLWLYEEYIEYAFFKYTFVKLFAEMSSRGTIKKGLFLVLISLVLMVVLKEAHYDLFFLSTL